MEKEFPFHDHERESSFRPAEQDLVAKSGHALHLGGRDGRSLLKWEGRRQWGCLVVHKVSGTFSSRQHATASTFLHEQEKALEALLAPSSLRRCPCSKRRISRPIQSSADLTPGRRHNHKPRLACNSG